MTTKAPTEIIRADDFVEYFLFPALNPSSDIDSGNNNVTDSLEEIRTQIVEESNQFIGNYIWHKDPFQLIVKSENLKLTNDNDEEGKYCDNKVLCSISFMLFFFGAISRRIAAPFAWHHFLWRKYSR